MARPSLLLVLCCCLLWGPAAHAQTSPNIMPVSEIHVGMTGIGRTVILGTEIQDFNVEVIGVLERGGFNGGPMILVRGSGPVLDATGGFAGGYSGSPVYIGERMIGAISAAWFFADHSIAGVTPIGEMLKNLDYPLDNAGLVQTEPVRLSQALDIEGQEITSSRIAPIMTPTAESVAADAAAGQMTLVPCKTPLFVNGLNPEMIERIKAELGPHMPYIEILPGLGPSAAAAGSSGSGSNTMELFAGLQPGAAIGAQLVAGDIDLTAIGTLTYIDDQRVLAFGHPFLQAGPIELPLTKARIVHTMKSIQRSFKMGEAIGLVGTINQDRSTAIAGRLGQMPHMIPFHLTVKDNDLGRTRRYDYSVVDYEAILPFLGLLPPMQGLGEVMDRQGPATIKSHFQILTNELEPIERTNLFYDQFSGSGFMELANGLFLLSSANIFKDVTLKEVFIDVEVTETRQTTDIIKADFVKPPSSVAFPKQAEGDTAPPSASSGAFPLQEGQTSSVNYQGGPMIPVTIGSDTPKQVKAGETIAVEVRLKPYRQEEQKKTLTLTIPKDMAPGQTTLEIRGGGRLPSIFQMANGGGLAGPVSFGGVPVETEVKPIESLEDLVKEFESQEQNNILVMELFRTGDDSPMPGVAPNLINPGMIENPQPGDADDRPEVDVPDLPPQGDPGNAAPEPIKTTIVTDRVIFGTYVLPIEIVAPTAAKPSDPPADEDDKGKGKKKKRAKSGD